MTYYQLNLATWRLFVTSGGLYISYDEGHHLFKCRFISLVMVTVIVALCAAPNAEAKAKKRSKKPAQTQARQASGVNDARYAALIMNPVTGEIYHQSDADQRRYPASLTKMMTLYLLFEAIEQKKLSLDDDMDVSALAARQPQTNLSLDDGDEIEVETAIKALVVRSANDVSVVVAEALAGDVETFARKMTAKAKALGMTNTVFKNPNGLPNSGQVTTARDMAKLGIALKRDFPRYYRYFSTLQFSHNGVSYYTHNRVMLRYAGVDGIKTGYIGASGFNLVTSVVRGGRPLVGVVMGGGSGRWRDDRMIQLLDASYETVAKRGAAKGRYFPANLPVSRAGKRVGTIDSEAGADAAQPAANPQTLPESSEGEDGGVSSELPPASLPVAREAVRAATTATTTAAPAIYQPAAPTPVPAKPSDSISRAPIMVPVPAQQTLPTQQTPSQTRVITVSPPASPPTTLPAPPAPSPFDAARPPIPAETMIIQPQAAPAPAPAASTQPQAALVGDERGWGIQVGAFSSQALAVAAARNALQIAAKPLVAARLPLADAGGGATPVHRARLENLSQLEARKACEALINQNSPCFIYKAAP